MTLRGLDPWRHLCPPSRLNRCGITPLHRVSFKPVRKHLRVQPNPVGANPVTAGLYSAWRKQEDGYKSKDT